MDTNPTQSAPRLAFVLVAAALLFPGCGEEKQQRRDKPVPVRVWTVQPGTFRRTLRSVGNLRAARRVELRAETPGHVQEIRFQRGQKVSAGEVLFVLKKEELTKQLAARVAQRDELKVRAAEAERSYRRYLDVYEQGAATTEEMDRLRSRWKALEAQVRRVNAEIELIREKIRDTRVRTLSAGTMGDHLVDVGDFVNIGDPLATLVTPSALEIHFQVGQQEMDQVALGQTVRFTVDAWPKRTFAASVSYVAPRVRESTRRLPLIALVDDPNGLLRPGTFAKTRLITDVRRNVPTIPEEALVSTREGYEVFIVENGTARRQSVKTGLRRPGWVEIREGIEPGETVVRTGQLQLREERKVRIVADTTTQPTSRPATQPASRPAGGGRP
ncbi:MAG: efflux RND transporter periplasmic adaptor subunit [Planctomycetota bacterium]